jgi:hypothetical protein
LIIFLTMPLILLISHDIFARLIRFDGFWFSMKPDDTPL